MKENRIDYKWPAVARAHLVSVCVTDTLPLQPYVALLTPRKDYVHCHPATLVYTYHVHPDFSTLTSICPADVWSSLQHQWLAIHPPPLRREWCCHNNNGWRLPQRDCN